MTSRSAFISSSQRDYTMRPNNLKSRIFLDGGDPAETRDVLKGLGFLDGQTTNPTLIAKNPEAKKRLERGEKFKKEEVLDFYRGVVRELSALLPQGREMFEWIPNAHVKFPGSREGLRAAEQAVRDGLRVNLTLCFSQEQAAAVYGATRGAKKGDVFISPFIGRLDDRGEDGMDLIANIIRMYRKGDGHVEVLTASVRSLDHFLQALALGSDIITAPYEVLKSWAEKGLPVPGQDFRSGPRALKPIPYRRIDLTRDWERYHIRHDLTDKGMEKFSADWNALIL